MRSRRSAAVLLAWLVFVVAALPGHAPAVGAADYILESAASYDVRPDDGEIRVGVELTFTNTTPDPPDRFSVFDELQLAIHDAATEVAASDADGELEVSAAVNDEGVHVATIQLRDELRHEEEATLELTYTLPDGDDPQLRVRPSVTVFPAWSFGTAGEVSVSIPAGYEVRVDGDPLTEEGARLTSGPIEDPGQWLALVTAVRPAELVERSATVPLTGGTADLLVRAFADDEAWGERTLALVVEALPLIETEVGLPYPRLGQLILTEAAPTDASGFAESVPTGNEILVAFDQPPFTALHQVAHTWLSPTLVDARWIREGMASEVAARVAEPLGVELPYDPVAEAQARVSSALPLDAWSASGSVGEEIYGYAASWAVIDEIEAIVGADALRRVLARVADSVGPYDSAEIDPEPSAESVGAPSVPLDTRAFLDHLETVADADLVPLFRDRVLTAEDVALLEPRAEARAALDQLVADAASWGAPDPIRAAMRDWSFEDASAQITVAADWLERRDALLVEMERAGLAAPERLQQAYRAYGGGPEASDELEAERAVVEAYSDTAEDVTAERSFIERIGLVGGPDPQAELTLASGRFADGDLRGAFEAINEAQRIALSAETAGVVRLASLALLLVLLVAAAVIIFRRRASPAPPR
jgi:hypothetical protein